MYHVTMQITWHIPEFARKERNLHCDVEQGILSHSGSRDRSDPDVAIKICNEDKTGRTIFNLYSPMQRTCTGSNIKWVHIYIQIIGRSA